MSERLLALSCAGCQADNPPGSRFCNACGAALQSAVPATTTVPASTPTHLAARILKSRNQMERERKQVTVLFADVKGSMEHLADRDAEEARELLDAVLERMMEAVHRYDGVVNQVMGDGIMALFGAPLACEDHGVRACFAALRMQEQLQRFAEEVRRTHAIPLQIRVGVNSGEVVVRSVRNDLSMDYTAVGQTTHLAARLEQMAVPGSVLISASTLRLASRSIAVKELGPTRIKGLEAPVLVYQLLRGTPLRSIARVAAVRRSGRLVGRTGELAHLRQLLEQAHEHGGRAVGVVGEAGVGKSRLAYEFINSQTCRVMGSCALSYDNVSSWAPLIDVLHSYFALDAGQRPDEVADMVRAKMRGLDASLEGDIAPVLSLLDALPSDDPFRNIDARDRKQRLLGALTRLILRASQQDPLLLVFENLQWLDQETRAFLEALVPQVQGGRLLLLMNYRPDFKHDWHQLDVFTELPLEALSAPAARELLDALLGHDRSFAGVHDMLIERSNGNPFLLEEIVNTLVETNAIVGEEGARRLVAKADVLDVPPTVQAVIAARIDRLSVEERSLLQQASVLGTDVPLALLEAVLIMPESDLRGSLRSLQTFGFIDETNMFPDLEYRFRHSVTRDVAYSGLLKEQRRALHTRAVAAIEALYANSVSSRLDDLAVHAIRGEVWDKAVHYYRLVGLRAQQRGANAEAVHCFEEALRALAQLPSSRAMLEIEIDLRSALRPALLQLGRLAEILAVSRRVESLALELGDQKRLAQAYSSLTNYHYLKGETAAAIEYGARCIEIAKSCGDTALEATARQYIGQGHHARGEYLLAEGELKRNVARSDGSANMTAYVSSCAWLAFSLAERGQFEDAADYAHRAEDTARATGVAYNQMIALTFTGLVSLRRGRPGRAVLPLQRAYEICAKRGLTVWEPVATSLLGLTLVRLANEQDGLRLLEESVAVSRELGVRAYLAAWTANLAEGQLVAGQKERALATAEEALRLAREAGERGHEAHALWLLGRIRGEPGAFQEAQAIARELGALPLVAQTHLELGQHFLIAGAQAQAKEHIATGQRLLHELDMCSWYDHSLTSANNRETLYIVARSHPQLYEFLAQEFTPDRGNTVVMDRRERLQGSEVADVDRRQIEVDQDLLAWGLALSPRAPDSWREQASERLQRQRA